MRRIPACAALLVVLGARAAFALPWVPERDDEVLEELPASEDRQQRALRDLRGELARYPGSAAAAARLARAYVEAGRGSSDPRWYGRAEGVLRPWWSLPEPPPDVLFLRATLRQNRHEFAPALADLDQLLARDPRNAEAWLTRAVILQVRGEPAAASRSCVPLLRLAPPLTATTCLANAAALAGRGERSFRLLRRAIEASQDAPVAERVFALGSLAELAARLGRSDDAEGFFAQALTLAPRDAYLLAARADLLLDADRPEEVVELLGEETRVDGLLLRLALAERRLGSPGFAGHLAELRARFAAGRARGDALHLGEEARAALDLLGDPREALRLARANFAVQREPRDARVLLEAALAARESAAAEPVLRWLRESGLEDAQLARLADQVAALQRAGARR